MIAIYLGYIMDLMVGDPYWLPHPVIKIGNLIKALEKKLYPLRDKKMAGIMLLLSVMLVCYGVPYLILQFLGSIGRDLKIAVEAFMIFQILATKCLYVETKKVSNNIKSGNISEARKYVSYLCSRDTSHMTEDDILRTSIETVSENIVDGIVSPLFFIFIGGAPLGWLYKGVNTLDSMVGYKNDQYMDYGWASAKFDDLLNYIPARITGCVIIMAAFVLNFDWQQAFKILKRDKRNHASPNSGYSEAPVAGALNIQLGGRVSYFGKFYDKPTMGNDDNKLTIKHLYSTFKIMFVTSGLSVILFSIVVNIMR